MSNSKPAEFHVERRITIRIKDSDYKMLKLKSYQTGLSLSDITRIGIHQMVSIL